MRNFQLYRTNVLLGGQMKYDIVLGSDNDELVVKDFHITPISKSVPYNKYSQDSLLNYTHQENIRSFYKKTTGSFYKDFMNPLLESDWPLPSNYSGDTCDTTYEMGCRRMSYQLYGKQFEFLCPVWLEKLDDIGDLEFCFKFYSNSSQESLIAQKTLEFKKKNTTPTYHKKFIDYMNSYIKYLGLNKGCDWVLDVTNKYGIINGLNVSTGQRIDDLSLPNLYNHLKVREKPLIESDNLIIRELEKNSLITKQLFNFNLCFNIEDFKMVYVDDLMHKNNMYVNVEVRVKDSRCELVDIFSNYEYIQKTVCSPQVLLTDNKQGRYIKAEVLKKNVLDYLYDYKCSSIIYKNKIIQNICHWSLSEHPEYLFNLYPGFESLIENEGQLYPIQSNMGAPVDSLVDISIRNRNQSYEKYSPMKHQYWCNVYTIGNYTNSLWGTAIADLFTFTNHYLDLFSKFHKNCVVRNVRYGVDVEANKNYYFAIFDTSGTKYDAFNTMFDSVYNFTRINWQIYKQSGVGCWYVREDGDNIYIILRITNKEDKAISYSAVKYHLSRLLNKSASMEEFYEIISNKQYLGQIRITLQSGLKLKKVVGPNNSLNIEEVEYIKDDADKSILRTLGKIKPFFITVNNDLSYKNYKHYKKVLDGEGYKWNNCEGQQYKFRPNYPSIDYFSLYHKDENYELDSSLKHLPEYNHYSYNKIQYLPSTFNDEIVIAVTDQIQDKIAKCLESRFSNNEVKEYVIGLYSYKILSTEFTDAKGDTQKCTIQFKLK